MKIDEGSINHNALRLIAEEVSELFEFSDNDPGLENMRLCTLGEIRGICQLADALKEVLRA